MQTKLSIASTATLMILAGILVGSIVAAEPAATATAPATTQSALEDKPFTDSKSGISLRLPKGWVVKKGISDTGYEAPAKDRDDIGGLAPNVIMACENTPGIKPADLATTLESKRKQYAKTFDSVHETKFETIKLAGHDAGIIGFTQMVQKVLKVEQRQVWIITDGKRYTVTFTTLASTSEKNVPLFDEIIKTIKVP